MSAPFTLILGDCLESLRTMPENSVDSIVTDPPYGLSFMGKKWDYDVPAVEVWAECLRVLKPGGYLLAFAGTRTQHRMAVRIEDAGFEIRDMIAWVYGSGFPKSHNGEWGGTALKPALEPITMARKPLVGTVASNVLEWGTGGLNIDGCRVGDSKNVPASVSRTENAVYGKGLGGHAQDGTESGHNPNIGRWPANLIHDGSEEVLAAFPQAPGQQAAISGSAPSDKTSNVYGRMRREGEVSADSDNDGAVGFKMKPGMRRLDTGSAARFFYCAKASKRDRDEGLDAFAHASAGDMTGGRAEGSAGLNNPRAGAGAGRTGGGKNIHPTVKPTELMAYLCRLVTPTGGVVLDPFMGSGSTGKAAMREGFRFIGCELSPEYIGIASARIEHEIKKIDPPEPEITPAVMQSDLFGAEVAA